MAKSIKSILTGKPSEEKTMEEKLQARKLGQLQDYKRVFSSEQGKRVLSDLIANHYVMGSTYRQNDEAGMAFREGQRQVVLRIMTIMKYEPEEVMNAIRESDKYVSTL